MNEYVSRIPNISCMKSWIEGHGRAVLGSIANSARYRQNRLCSLARPSHALQCRISCKIYLESLKHPHSPCVSLVNHSCNLIYKILSVLLKCSLILTICAQQTQVVDQAGCLVHSMINLCRVY